jgi:two-component system sensor histidine kinase TorS
MALRKRILVAEDDPISRQLFGMFLSSIYDLHLVDAIEDAKKMLLGGITYDLVITDISFDEQESGVELLEFIRANEQLKHTPVFAHSAHLSGTDHNPFLNKDFDGFIPKPTVKEQLIKMIEHTFKKGRAE